MERIILTISGDMLQEIDALAQRTQRKRSRLIRDALSEWLGLQRRREADQLLAEGYQVQARELEELASDFERTQAEAAETVWRWDA